MSDETAAATFFTDLKREWQEFRQTISYELDHFWVTIRNHLRQMRGAKVDYVILPIGGPLPERASPPRSFIQRQLPLPLPPQSLQVFNQRLQVVGDASNAKGVLLVFRGFACGLATLENLRRSIQRLQAADKEVLVYTPYLDLAHYFVAAAADRIIVPPGAQFNVLGLRTEAIFLKDALARIGIEMEAIQISPYKTGPNIFNKADMTPEQQEQLDWLLDDQFDLLLAAIADGRDIPIDELKALIDQAPYAAEVAQALGLVDDVAYEDELAGLLAEKKGETETEVGTKAEAGGEERGDESDASDEGKGNRDEIKAKLATWAKARPLLLEKARHRPAKFIGVITLDGLIVMGPSRQPPIIPLPIFGGAAAGEQTLLRLLRQVEKIPQMAALIFLVDSGGGSALASELITREIERLNKKLPVLAYMGNVAASGGYHVSAKARHIMCQKNTITGSIGVFMIRPNTQGLYQKLQVKRVALQRGERAGLYSDAAPLTDDEGEALWQSIEDTYRSFKQVVADGRSLPFDELDPICEGRVWTGRQALAHKLVDSHGDFVDAIRMAAELAGLPTGEDDAIPVVNLHPKSSRHLPPQPFAESEPTTSALNEIGRLISGETVQEFSGQPLLLMPFDIKIR